MKKIAIYQKKRAGASTWANKWIQSPDWLKGFGAFLAVCGVLYLVNMMWGDLDPGSTWGLGYGIAAAVLFVGALLYGMRRKVIRVNRFQRAWNYLQLHVYGGTLFLILVLMHINFNVPKGVLTWWLWALSIWIVCTGLLGSVLQKWIPTILNSSLSTEVNFNRIPELIAGLEKRAEKLAGQSGQKVKDLFHQSVASKFKAPQFRWIFFVDVAGTIRRDLLPFAHLGKYLDAADKNQLDELEVIYKTKLEIDAHYTLQKTLRAWLILHIPVALLILVLLVIHVLTVVYY
ncbi:MAG: hypothetical protein AB8G77_03725 [Rhodothermales bacterium]